MVDVCLPRGLVVVCVHIEGMPLQTVHFISQNSLSLCALDGVILDDSGEMYFFRFYHNCVYLVISGHLRYRFLANFRPCIQ